MAATIDTARAGAPRVVNRREFVAELMELIPEALVVTGLGSPTYDVFAAGARPEHFHLWGAMGAAAPLALGLALAQPDRSVVAITGDGEQLMGIGALATIGASAPPNLTIVVLDNGHYGETGMQRSHTSLGADLVAVAKGFGIADALLVSDGAGAGEVAERVGARRGTTFVQVLIDADEPPRALPPRDGVANKNAFGAALGIPTF
jgi:thiamine pyrophosphate-dependent acetolactate synthase large subunit-like protein